MYVYVCVFNRAYLPCELTIPHFDPILLFTFTSHTASSLSSNNFMHKPTHSASLLISLLVFLTSISRFPGVLEIEKHAQDLGLRTSHEQIAVKSHGDMTLLPCVM